MIQSAEIRAARILSRLAGYRAADGVVRSSEMPVNLGKWIGRYENPGETGIIDIFMDGLAWYGRETGQINYADISEVKLNEQKASKELILRACNGETHRLPVEGGSGQFLDSMEFLRFIDRVTAPH